MPGKYNIDKGDYKYLFSIIDMECSGKYHQIYKDFGVQYDKGTSFFCVNSAAHASGGDKHASMSIDSTTGKYHCFACGIKGNLPIFYKEFVANGPMDRNDGSFTSWAIDCLHLERFLSLGKTEDDKRIKMEMKELYEKLNGEKVKETGQPYVMGQEVKDQVKKEAYIDQSINDGYVTTLMGRKDLRDYLEQARNIKEEHILKYRIGYNGQAFTFPMFSINGDLVNIKAYQPLAEDIRNKWTHPFPGNPSIPSPAMNFMHNKIYIMEGEPDCYCAIGFGLNAVTLGSAANVDVNKIFGPDVAKQLFTGKEIVIVTDADDSGVKASKSIAASVYPYAKQVKIINLDKSDINPYGLDPELMKDVEGKQKRAQKDFTDFMKLNGFNDTALKLFLELEINTKVYSENISRKQKQIFKVTLQEARLSRYYSDDGMIELDLIASVGDVDCSSFKYPHTVEARCKCMRDDNLCEAICSHCSIPDKPGFGEVDDMTFKFEKEYNSRDSFSIRIKEHDILGLIETTDDKKNIQKKRLLKIAERCNDVVLTDKGVNGLIHVRLVRDIAETADESAMRDAGASEIDMEAYMLEKDIYPNKSYRFKAVQTTAWNGQHAVLFCYTADPIATSIDTFVMNDETNDLLQIFKQKKDETIQQALDRRYEVFSNASGINSREDLFFLNDLVYFSPIEIDNKTILPAIKRGWVEVLIAGQSRCGKTVVSKFMHNHYKIGEFLGGSNAVSRTGLVGSIEYYRKKPTIKWGKFPMNDGGVVVIDELSIISEKDFDDLTYLRSEGLAELVKQKYGVMRARVRKIMLSNKRTYKNADYNSENASEGGIEMLKRLCGKDHILARFDIAYIVASDDVETFSSAYEQMSTEFTEYQCQTLIKWTYSRKPADVIFEDGFEDALNVAQERMLEKFHKSTQLVNQEMRAKLARLSISLASMLYSTLENDYNKIYVKNEYVMYMMDYLTKIYCGKNMYLDRYSDIQKKQENLGDMAVMINMLKYVDMNLFMQYSEFSVDDIKVIFAGVLSRVSNNKLCLVDGVTDDKIRGKPVNDLLPILVNLLLSRNCIVKVNNRKYQKTDKFNKWLSDRINDIGEGKHVDQSSILELESDEQNSEVDKKTKTPDPSNWAFRKEPVGEF
jgi:hypothetical protein